MNTLGNAAKAVFIGLGICAAIGLIVLLSPLWLAMGYLVVAFVEVMLPVIIVVAIIAGVFVWLTNH